MMRPTTAAAIFVTYNLYLVRLKVVTDTQVLVHTWIMSEKIPSGSEYPPFILGQPRFNQVMRKIKIFLHCL